MVVAVFFAARLFVARLFASDLDLSFTWMPVAFDDHLSPGAFVATVDCRSVIVASCHQHAGSDCTEQNDLND